jgi:hypothetical protein
VVRSLTVLSLDPLVALRYESFRRLLFEPHLLFIPILPEFGKPPPFFCHSFFRAPLRANSWVLQLHIFCVSSSSFNQHHRVPSHKAAARFGSKSLRLWVPQKNGAEKRDIFHVLFDR